MKVWSAVGLVCVFFATVVCGGGGGGGTSSTNSTIQITWGDITRSVLTGPSSARSVRLVFQGAGANGDDTEIVVNRSASILSSYTGTYTLPPNTSPSGKVLSATFYAGAGPADVVATATATMSVANNSVNLANISIDGKVKTVVAQPLTMFKSDGTASLQFTARDQANNILAVAPGSARWSIVSGDSISATPDGIVSGLKAGQTNVKANVDGIDSQAVAVSINIDFLAYDASVSRIKKIAFAADGTSISSIGGGYKMWNSSSGALIRGDTRNFAHIASNPVDSSKLAICFDNLRIYDFAANSEVGFDGQKETQFVAFSPDGSKIASIGLEQFGIPLISIRVWNVSNRTMIWKQAGINGGTLAFSPDGSKLVYGGYGNEVTIYDASAGTVVKSLRPEDPLNASERILGLSFSPDGKYLATAGPSETDSLDIWDLTSLSLKQTITLPDGDAYDVKFSPDGELLAAASSSGKIYLYPTSTYVSPKSLVGHSGICYSLDFSPSTNLLASGGFDKRIRVWSY